MKQYDAIPVRPMRAKGVLGIASIIFKRGFWASFLFYAVWQLIILAACAAAFLPLGSSVRQLADTAFSGAPSDFGIIWGVTGGSMLSNLLAQLLSVAMVLLFTPIINGTLYTEMSMRMFGEVSTTRQLFKRTRFSLKRFFSTSLVSYVSNLAVSAVLMIISVILIVVGALSVWGRDLDTPYIVAGLIAAFVLLMTVAVIGQSFLGFAYSVRTNEDVSGFRQIGRSIRLSSKRFGRVFGMQLAYNIVVFILLAAYIALADLVCYFVDWNPIAVTAFAVIAVIGYIPLTLYAYALVTVLYFDTRVRVDGDEWLKPAVSGNAPIEPSTVELPAYQQPAYQPIQETPPVSAPDVDTQTTVELPSEPCQDTATTKRPDFNPFPDTDDNDEEDD